MRSVPRSACSCFVLLFLGGCVKGQELEPAEVLRRAAQASRELQSASIIATVTFDTVSQGSGSQGSIHAEGRTQGAGQQIALHIIGGGTNVQDGAEWQAAGDIVIGSEHEVYVRMETLSSPTFPFPADLSLLSNVRGQWWKLPSRQAVPMAPVTPDPKFLRMQTEVVDIARDHGIEVLQGRRAYHYDTTVNREKLLQFLEEVSRERGDPVDSGAWRPLASSLDVHGELWIDAETFFVRSLSWSITSTDAARPLTATLTMDMSDFNASAPIEIPKDAVEFPGSSSFLPLPDDLMTLPSPSLRAQ